MKTLADAKPTAEDIEVTDEGTFDWSRAHPPRRGRKLVVPLAGVRQAANLTQTDVAQASGFDQGEVSRLERREDWLLSTLRRYAEGLGAELEVAFVKNGHRVFLRLPEEGTVGTRRASPRLVPPETAAAEHAKGTDTGG
ncbi:MAG: helix-turn-helix domain-containing protein [Myxococcales bacterium]